MAVLTQEQISLVTTLYNNGQIQEAIDKIKALDKDFPNVPLLFNILGVCYQSIGQLQEASQAFLNAIKIKSDYTEAHFNLGLIYQQLNKLDSAIKAYKNVISLTPNYPSAHNNLGIIYLEMSQLDIAVEHFEWALAYKYDFAEAYNNLGATLQKQGKLDLSLNNFKQAIAIKPEYAQAHSNLGNLFQISGEVDSAVNSFESAIAHKPEYAEAHRNLSILKKYSENDVHITQMKSLFSNTSLSNSNRMHLSFALAKVNEDLGREDQLFEFLNEGNRLRKEQLNFSFDKFEKRCSVIKNLFSTTLPIIEKSSTIRPIFIVGMPRSGTSLVEQIISNHHQVYGGGELEDFSNIINSILQDEPTSGKANLSLKTITSSRQKYLDVLSRFNTSKKIITDKLPLNFRYIGFILSAFPEAKIIHVKRDSMATCWSIYKHYFSSKGTGWAYSQEDIAKYYRLYLELMEFWHKIYPNQIYDLGYEDLTTNQEEETQKLLEYCELEWDQDCLNFHTNERAVHTASLMQVRKKMYQGSSEVWKQYSAHLEPLIKGLGF
ncbi:sulfotransferase [Candidatus Thioglobus sp.]|nr:sulfotransferase [Candidatus Thioglobus sp.]